MGSFASVFQNESQPTMKVLLFVALAIAAVMAEPEAEPKADAAADAWYGYYGGYADITDIPTTVVADTTGVAKSVRLKLNPLLLPKLTLMLMPLLMPGTDITDIPDTTVDTDTDMVLDTMDTDGVDITDTPTPTLTDTGAAKSVKLNPLPLLRPTLRPTLRLKPHPGTMAVGVDIMDTPIIGDITDGEDIVVTGGKL